MHDNSGSCHRYNLLFPVIVKGPVGRIHHTPLHAGSVLLYLELLLTASSADHVRDTSICFACPSKLMHSAALSGRVPARDWRSSQTDRQYRSRTAGMHALVRAYQLKCAAPAA